MSKQAPKKSKLATENLFLLEFLVDDLKLDAKCNCMNPGGVCVCFQFLDNEPLDVCEEDFSGGNKFGEDAFKTGKSCLFSLTPQQTQKVLRSFDITVGVYKKMPLGSQPEKACVGSAKVSVVDMFIDLVKSHDELTCAKVLQDTYTLVDDKKSPVGKIGVYIRLSCYGKTIVTQFQMNMDDKSVLFKDKDGHSLYRYKKSKKGRTTKIEDLSCQEDRPPPCLQPQQCPNSSQQMYQQQYEQQQYPPPNPNCPQQPCFPPSGMGGPGMMGPGMGGPGVMGPGMGGPGMMGPGMGGPGMGPGMGGPGMMGPGMGGPGMMGPGMFPPPNPNCPNQPCFPPNYGMENDDCPVPGKPCQQVSFAMPAGTGGCGGGCGRG